MKSLKKQLGLPISLNDDSKLVFDDPSLAVAPKVRLAKDMEEVILKYSVKISQTPSIICTTMLLWLPTRN